MKFADKESISIGDKYWVRTITDKDYEVEVVGNPVENIYQDVLVHCKRLDRTDCDIRLEFVRHLYTKESINFEIVKSDCKYPVVIYSLSYVSPLGKIPVIEKKLESYKGKVLFDLLLSNGFASNRYIEAEFNEGKFLIGSFRAVEPDIEIKMESSSFYLKEPSLLDNGILHNPQKFLFKKGKIL